MLADAEMPAQLKSTEEVIEADDPEPPAPARPAPVKTKRPPVLSRREVSDGPPTPSASTPEPAVAAPAGPTSAAESGTGAKTAKGPKVPNFGRLQRRVLWIGLAVLLVAGYFVGMYLFTTAKVTLYANGTKADIDTTFAVDPDAKTTDATGAVLAGQTVSSSKDLSGPITPTGKKDAGTKASGTITISNCLDSDSHTFVAGTRFKAPDGKQFRSTADVVVPGGQGNFFGCTTPGTATVNVQADENGDSYNEAPATYTMPGLPDSQQSGQNSIISKGAQMGGGTSKTVTVVTQADVDSAKAALLAKDKDNAGRDLQGRIPKGYVQLATSQATSTSAVSASPDVNAEATSANLSLKVTYTVLAVKKTDYQAVVRAQELKQIGNENQIYDDGLDAAQVTASDKDSSGRPTFHFTTEAFSGVKIDTAALATKIKGKRYGDANDTVSHQPGVTHSDISITPAWASSLPGRTDKIKITIQVEGNK